MNSPTNPHHPANSALNRRAAPSTHALRSTTSKTYRDRIDSGGSAGPPLIGDPKVLLEVTQKLVTLKEIIDAPAALASVAIATITHEDTGQGKEGPPDRFLGICLAFAIVFFGAAMVEWGGLWSVTFFDTLNIAFRETGIVCGIVCGLFNIDKTTQIPGNRQQAK